jgi:two-component system CheB/CheR fusion protein
MDRKKGATHVSPASATAPARAADAFPLVGLGASAGGLEALEQFLTQVPPDCGMGFVVVQHMDPTHKGLLVELLQRITPMPVVQATDRLKVQPDHVYVIPPNKALSILHGQLHLLEPAAPRGLRLPIDFFFRALAVDWGDLAVGVVLSGMGSDGTLGLRAIREAAGLIFVQAPASAKFDGMPRSAIDAGLADVVAPAEELPARILTSLHREARTSAEWPKKDLGALDKIVILLRAQTGHDFSLYKKPTIHRRIERRMGLHQLGSVLDYVHYLQENPAEVDLLFQELLIGVTQFFRDPLAWDRLRDDVFPALFAANPQGAAFRAWTPGCSTGEEVYSLAMVFREALERLPHTRRYSLSIFGTDLDKNAIDRARRGLYPASVSADLSPSRLARFFSLEERGYRVRKEIREMVIFAPQNIAMDPPFTKLDLLTCRNLLIYLDAELQKKLMPLFHHSLKPGGILFLGSAETIGTATDLFTPMDRKHRLYRRLNRPGRLESLEFPSCFVHRRLEAPVDPARFAKGSPIPPNLEALTGNLLLQRYVPSAVLVGAEGDILFSSGRTGKYLEPAVGAANLNIFAMARPGLDLLLNEAFHRALREQGPVVLRQVKVGTNGGTQFVDVTLEVQREPGLLKDKVMIIFMDVPAPAPGPETGPASATGGTSQGLELHQAREALKLAHAELNTTREDMQISREELNSTNEELQSINEELQSTNEELTTSKEEMQSMNEELQTVNHELQAKVDELSSVNNDLKNLLNSTDIATLFLDDAFAIRRFTTQAAKIIRLLPGDLGRPITDITTLLVYPELAEDARGVLETLVFKERQVIALDQRWFNVRIMPYRTVENRIDGVVITFADVTVAHALEEALRVAAAENERLRHQLNGAQPLAGTEPKSLP